MTTDVTAFIGELDGGNFESKISGILSDVAGAVIDHNSKGQVILTFDMKKIGNSSQVHITHSIKYKRPTSVGERQENASWSTPMYVGTRGAISFFPEKQGRMFGVKGEVDVQVPE